MNTAILINQIRQSDAFWNDCFEKSFRSPVRLPAETLKKLASNWYAITKEFAQTLPGLIVSISKELHSQTDSFEKERLETLGREALKILGNDWGLGIKKFDSSDDHKIIHYKLFERVPERLGFVDELEPETKTLMENLSFGFSQSPEIGFGKLLTVEYTASSILRIGDVFSRAVDTESRSYFTSEDLVYFSLHEELEKTHASDIEKLISLVGNTKERDKELLHSVETCIEAFSNFWNKMTTITF